MNHHHISFIGGGNMAQSLLRGLIASGHNPRNLTASDPDAACRQAVEALGANAVQSNQGAVNKGDLLVLAVKPQVAGAVLQGLEVPSGKLLVSICAGVPVVRIAEATAPEQPIVRTMPNTPALLQAGVTALYANGNVNEAQRTLAHSLMAAVGKAVWVEDEALLDAVTAVSGSGPAYFFLLMEAMMEAAEGLGLDAGLAATLTVETAFGAAQLARQGTAAPAALRRKVTSPGGTTAAALSILERRRVKAAFVEALFAARQRSRKLAEGFATP